MNSARFKRSIQINLYRGWLTLVGPLLLGGRKVFDYEKTHDGVMNNIESLVGYNSSLTYLDYCDTKEYRECSKAIYNFFTALEEDSLTEEE